MAGINYGNKYTTKGSFKYKSGKMHGPRLKNPCLNAKITAVYDVNTKSLLDTFNTQTEMAAKYNIDHTHLSHIVKKNKYKELNECHVYKEKYIFIDQTPGAF